MEVSPVEIESISDESVTGISQGSIYFLSLGRNSWNGRWTSRYTNKCMHTNLISAKEQAEVMREQGATFSIEQLPCVVFRANHFSLIVTEINNFNPLSGYFTEAEAEKGTSDRKSKKDACWKNLGLGVPLSQVGRLLLPQSSCWRVKRKDKDSVIFLTSESGSLSIEKHSGNTLFRYKSYSLGGNYTLGWHKKESDIRSSGVLEVYKAAKNKN